MAEFIPGQRCISDAELQMGLGTILSVEERTLTVLFMATGDTRTYSKQSAPLTRVQFSVGDNITRHDGLKVTVTALDEEHGLITYTGRDTSGTEVRIEESELDNFIQLNRPSERLFNGQIDKDNWFELRYQTLYHKNRLAKSDLYGLTGSRTSLIPHQLYIAHEVANRYAPRVLLADEVGLGKTIEAGLILHHQLLTERARRVLIVVPETLVHQWLVEMLRRFNLHFKIFDNERCENLVAANEYENIFHSEQLVLCSIDFLVNNADMFEQCVFGEWDLMVVDEAHHLQWSDEEPSIEYMVVEQLSNQTKGVLLLTATPEQLGKESHFARLRLLDPDRFPDYQHFIKEEESYEPYAQVIEDLLSDKALYDTDIELISATLDEGDNQVLLDMVSSSGEHDEEEVQLARLELVDHLLDRHGTGRVLFRNTRSAVKGFPERQLHAYPLPLPDAYKEMVAGDTEPSILLTPELIYRQDDTPVHWTQLDPRIAWLSKTCAELHPQKVLVIAASADTALDITQYFKTQTGLHATAFHEGLSIVERDRAAAFFADHETGSQVLVCSEIGSEGRNFQFAHHLVLFDLPINPDLLEQRIGRLDRIGQAETINIHVPYIEETAQAACYRWYHEALNAFEHTCPAGHSVYKRVQTKLHAVLADSDRNDTTLEELIAESRTHYQAMTESLQRGRDRLLEYNSCRPVIAQSIKQRADEADKTTQLAEYMENAFDCFGIDNELHSEGCFVLTPTEHMISQFPGLTEEGMTITYQRNIALSFEDAHFISWEHPMTNTVIDMVISNEMGNTSVTAMEYKGVMAGSVLLECLFSIESAPIEELQTNRYLPPTMIRVVCDERGADHNLKLLHQQINDTRTYVETGIGNKIVKAKRKILKAMLKRSEKYAELKAEKILQQAQSQAHETLSIEINRLNALSKVNPNIRADEIKYFDRQLSSLTEVIDNANLRLDAVRVIVAT